MMDDKEKLGMLVEQGRWFAKKIESIEKKVDHILEWRWKMWGVTAAIVVAGGMMKDIIIEVVMAGFHK